MNTAKVRILSLPILFLIFFLAGCTSLPQDSPGQIAAYRSEVESATRILLERSIQGASEKLRSTPSPPRSYLPPEISTLFTSYSDMPGLSSRISQWEERMSGIIPDSAVSMPALAQDIINRLKLEDTVDPASLSRGSLTATSLIASELDQILFPIIRQRSLLAFESPSTDGVPARQLWQGIKESYRIWSEAWNRLNPETSFPSWTMTDEEMITLFARAVTDDFLFKLAAEENTIRSTPIPQDNDPVAVIFQTL